MRVSNRFQAVILSMGLLGAGLVTAADTVPHPAQPQAQD